MSNSGVLVFRSAPHDPTSAILPEVFAVTPTLAVVGATGAVGALIRTVLVERGFAPASIKFLASAKSVGQAVSFRGRDYAVEPITPAAFEGVQIVLSSTPASVSREVSPMATAAGAIVIDNSSAWRMDPDCPLVVPEVNGEQLTHLPKRVVANPNCVAIPLTVALKPLHDLAGLQSVVVSTYQSSSGKGATGLADFDRQARAFGTGEPPPAPTAHKGQLAGNVLTLDWTLDANGSTEEENKVVHETRKILGLPDLPVHPTCVRVPVRVGHCESVHATFRRNITIDEAREVLRGAPGVRYTDEREGRAPEPLGAEGDDATFVSRLRQQPGRENAIDFWVVADNLRKGAATNAVQCAAELVRRGLVG